MSDEGKMPKTRASDGVDDAATLRRLLWLNHGCVSLYGDDGEMQCNACRVDFKRMSVKEIEARFLEVGLARLRCNERKS